MSSSLVQRGALHVAAGTEGEKEVYNELKTLSSPALTIHQPPLPASNEQKKKTVAVRGRWRPLSSQVKFIPKITVKRDVTD